MAGQDNIHSLENSLKNSLTVAKEGDHLKLCTPYLSAIRPFGLTNSRH